MKTPIKHILFVDADRNVQSNFNSYFDTDEIMVHNFNTAMGAIQHIKESQPADILIVDEHIKPMGAAQTLNYLIGELHFKSKVFVCSEFQKQFETDSGVFEVLRKPLNQSEFKKVDRYLDSFGKVHPVLYSLDYLKELSDGDEVFINQSIRLFIDTVGPRIAQLDDLLEKTCYQDISKLAHNIKPSFEMIMNKRGGELCDFLAHHAKPEDFKSHVADLKTEFKLVEEQINKDFAHEEN